MSVHVARVRRALCHGHHGKCAYQSSLLILFICFLLLILLLSLFFITFIIIIIIIIIVIIIINIIIIIIIIIRWGHVELTAIRHSLWFLHLYVCFFRFLRDTQFKQHPGQLPSAIHGHRKGLTELSVERKTRTELSVERKTRTELTVERKTRTELSVE